MALRQQEHTQALAKLERLRERLRVIGGAVVAFSSGVDSTFLLRVAHEELGDRVVAATARSHSFPNRELDEATAFCRAEGVRHVVIDSEELDIPGFAENPPDRCYHCKRELFGKLLAFARDNGLAAVLEGSNIDDDGDYRPGRRAIRELGILSPLHEAGSRVFPTANASRSVGSSGWKKRNSGFLTRDGDLRSCACARMATSRGSRCRQPTFRVSPRARRK